MAENTNGGVHNQNGNAKSPADVAAELEEQDRKEREERRRHREPPIVFNDAVNVSSKSVIIFPPYSAIVH